MRKTSLIPRLFVVIVAISALLSGPALVAFIVARHLWSRHVGKELLVDQLAVDHIYALATTTSDDERRALVNAIGNGRRRRAPGAGRWPPVDYDVWIVDENGRTLAATGTEPLPLPWASITRPTDPNRFVALDDRIFPAPRHSIARLPGSPEQYAIFRRTFQTDQWRAVYLGGVLLVSLLVSVVCVLALLWYLRRQAKVAGEVIHALQSGNLKARFPIHRLDEKGRFLLQFNQMADEIERLVGKLHESETARAQLLQDLAHDLRTPLFSLGNTVDTLWDHRGTLTPELLTETLGLARQEIEYFTRLLESLFLLAKVSEPRYRPGIESVSVSEVMQGEIAAARERAGRAIRIEFASADDADALVWGDPFLIRRLFRNLLDNAVRFAASRVTIELSVNGGNAILYVRDDGPGFSDEARASFGQRRSTRFLDASGEGRFSLGLGSVIIRSIVEAHRGTVEAGNWGKPGIEGGAQLTVILPTEAAPPLRRVG